MWLSAVALAPPVPWPPTPPPGPAADGLALTARANPRAHLPGPSAGDPALAARAPLALRYAKDAIRTAGTSDLAGAFDREVELQMICTESEDAQEGIKAFVQRREPQFKGR